MHLGSSTWNLKTSNKKVWKALGLSLFWYVVTTTTIKWSVAESAAKNGGQEFLKKSRAAGLVQKITLM